MISPITYITINTIKNTSSLINRIINIPSQRNIILNIHQKPTQSQILKPKKHTISNIPSLTNKIPNIRSQTNIIMNISSYINIITITQFPKITITNIPSRTNSVINISPPPNKRQIFYYLSTTVGLPCHCFSCFTLRCIMNVHNGNRGGFGRRAENV